MALVTCPDCQRQVSGLAKACPNCGRPLSRTPGQLSDREPTVGDAVTGTGRAIKRGAKSAWSTPLAAILALPVFLIVWLAIFITIETALGVAENGVGRGGPAGGVPMWAVLASFLGSLFICCGSLIAYSLIKNRNTD
jgi:hypothetical protein